MSEKFKEYIHDYLKNNPEFVIDIINKYNYPYPITQASMILALQFISFAKLFIDGYYDMDIVNNYTLAVESEEFDTAFEILVYEWKYVFLKIEVKWSSNPDLLWREIKVPIRNSMSDLIYSILAAFKCSGKHHARIYKEAGVFITLAEENEENCYIADEYPLFIINLIGGGTLIYDYKENWSFKIKCLEFEHVIDEQSCNNVILVDGKGNGVYEKDKSLLLEYISYYRNNNLEDFKSDIKIDFIDFDLEEYKKFINEEFEKIRLKYDKEFLVRYYNIVKEVEKPDDTNIIS